VISNSTISGNSATVQGGGIVSASRLTLFSTIVADNNAPSNADLFNTTFIGKITPSTINASYSLIENDADQINGSNTNNVTGQDPLLDAAGLQDNGGPTLTIALQTGSPAIDAGSNPNAMAYDQRGVGFDRVHNGQTDIGAFEFPNPLKPLDADPAANTVTEEWIRTVGIVAETTDPSIPGVEYSLIVDAGGRFVIDEDTGVVWTTKDLGSGPALHTITVQARDGAGNTSTTDFEIVVANVAPTVTLTGPNSVSQFDTFSYSFTISDPGDLVAVSLSDFSVSAGSLSNLVVTDLGGHGYNREGTVDVTFAAGPATVALNLQVQDPDLALSNSASISVDVADGPLSLVVDTIHDEQDGINAGAISLRDAIQAISTNGTITFDDSLSGQTLKRAPGLQALVITRPMTIDGEDKNITIDADSSNNNDGFDNSVLWIYDGDPASQIPVYLRGLTLTGGYHKDFGGGIVNAESLTLANCTIVDNYGYDGGGIVNIATMSIVDSTISGNLAGNYGAGIYSFDFFGIAPPQLFVQNSTIDGNSARDFEWDDPGNGHGGGLYIQDGNADIYNSTIANNTANQGGGLYNQGSNANIYNSTIADNTANQGGGLVSEGMSSLHSTIVADNTATNSNPDLLKNAGNVAASFSLIENDYDQLDIPDDPTNIIGLDPMLDPAGLLDNGGSTLTIALQSDSPAIDTGSNPTIMPFDQRGLGFEREFNGLADIGAYEFVDPDSDGVESDVEDSAPNDGDGNQDGIPDSAQDHVASLPNAVDQQYVTLVVSTEDAVDPVTLDSVDAVPNPSPTDAPGHVEFPIGFLDYKVSGVTPGAAATITILLPTGTTVNTFYKYGPESANPTDHWYEFLFDGSTGAEILPDRINLHFIDGQRGDDDLTINGVIEDPGAPGFIPNTPPVAQDDNVSVSEDATITFDVLADNGNGADSDAEGNIDLTRTESLTEPGVGLLTNNNDGTFTYDPNGAFESLAVGETGSVNFDYKIEDSFGESATATVTITITGENDGPTVSSAVSATATEDDAAFSVDLLQDAGDPDTSDVLNVDSLTLDSGDASGITVSGNSLSVEPSAYNHLAVGESEIIAYSYNVIDGKGGSVAQSATITITGENDGPVAVADTGNANEDGPAVSINLTGNDTDPDASDDTEILSIDTAGTLGTVTINVDNDSVTYDPNGQFESLAAGETTTDSFSYTVTDGNGGISAATITVTITGQNDAPTVGADNDPVTVNEGDTAENTGMFADIDVSDAIAITASVGTITQDTGANGTWTWSFDTTDGPDDSQTVTVTATDSAGAATTTSFDLTVNNVAPSVAVDNATVTINEGDVASNTGTFSDPGNDTVSITASIGTVTQDDAAETWEWSFNSTDGPDDSQTVTVTATDSDGAITDTTFTLTVTNVAPTVSDATFDVVENAGNGTVIGAVTASDPGDDTLTYTLQSINGEADPALFAFAIDAFSGEITVADSTQLDFETTPIFTLEVTVTDNDGATAVANVTVNLLNQASITGVVFVDADQDGLYDADEMGIDGVIIELLDRFCQQVLDDAGQAVTATTSGGGYYQFEDLGQGTYQIHEIQPTGVDDGAEHLGSQGGVIVANDTMELMLERADASDYDFAEIGQQVASGDTATIGFWQNKHGQALIAQGGTDLASWLTTNFGNVFGNQFDDADGLDVASFYKDQLFKQKGKKSAGPAKVDAQFMAAAFATYFTSGNLAGNVAAGYGFNVSDTGIGAKIVNVGSSGDAFDVADNSDRTIMQLLLATNDLTDQPDYILGFTHIYDHDGDGVIDASEKALRDMANDVYTSINEQGDI